MLGPSRGPTATVRPPSVHAVGHSLLLVLIAAVAGVAGCGVDSTPGRADPSSAVTASPSSIRTAPAVEAHFDERVVLTVDAFSGRRPVETEIDRSEVESVERVLAVLPVDPDRTGLIDDGLGFRAMRLGPYQLGADRYVLSVGPAHVTLSPSSGGASADEHSTIHLNDPANTLYELLYELVESHLPDVSQVVVRPEDLPIASTAGDPAQSQADAERDGVAPAIGSLPFSARVGALDEVLVGDQRWILSVLPESTRRSLIADGHAGPDLDPSGGEVLLVSDRMVVRAVPLNAFPPTFIFADGDLIYAGRVGDGGYPDSAVVRIDTASLAVERIVVPAGPAPDPDPGPEWSVADARQRDAFRSGDVAGVFVAG